MKINTLKNSRLCIAPMAIAVLGALLLAGCTSTKPDDSGGRASIKSPDGTIELTIRGNGPLTYAVSVNGKPLLADSRLGLKFKDGATLGDNARLVKVERNQSDTDRKSTRLNSSHAT